ncbi:sensor histidine kinase [Chryseolinea lacunae]|uniref:Histidine kinase n=1 Tax=Chryseolinea lacunae TaxID=2801331 RepID=A0ABS1KS36_9BACT|nr:histidine kinase [Chryseolinea lacunae]MBL0742174.1 histidine kinase [Chryseolinea lacunae]
MDSFVSKLVLSDVPSYRVARHVLFWVVCWAFFGMLYGFYFVVDPLLAFRISFTESFIFLPAHIFLSYGIIYGVLPNLIQRDRYWSAFVVTLVLIVMAAVISVGLNHFVVTAFRTWMHFPIRHTTVFYSFMGGLRGTMTVGGFAVAIKLVKHFYVKRIETEKLEKEKLRAELELLQGQLHPHFMFNTLNSIYSMALKKSDHTPEAILKLSQLMRYMLTDCRGDTIALNKEIQVLHDYIDLEKNRFGNRLDITVNVHGDIHQPHIAPLLLLPFVENSFKHGANEMIEQAWISLDLSVQQSQLKFKLINGKAETKGVGTHSAHVGLLNVKKRLELLYPKGHELRITEDADLFIVSLTLDLDKIKVPYP